MAEYHFSGSLVQRSKGQSAVARAAYNSREKLFDARMGTTWDYSRKQDCEHRAIHAPHGAPAWVLDRTSLWNAAEAAEGRRCNAQSARSFHIGLPRELSELARRDLVSAFVEQEFVRRGMVADVAIHRDEENPHFHLLVTMRKLSGDGFASTKQRAWNRKELLIEWREAWERHANLALAQEGHSARIDHRSYRARGIDLAPQPKLFRHQSQASSDRRDHVRERRLLLDEVAEENGRRILSRPETALEALTSRQSTFTHRDLLKLLHRHTSTRAQFEAALAAVLRSSELCVLHEDQDGQAVYSTRAVIACERSIVSYAHLLATRRGHRVRNRHLQQALALSPHKLTEEQVNAIRHVTQSGDLALVQGFAGTGKSSLLRSARLAWEGEGYTVVGGALTGRAAEGLTEEARIGARTLKSWIMRWEQGKSRLGHNHIFVLDEAAMVGSGDFQRIVEHVRKSGAKLVLVGDIEQLQPIEIGAPMRLLQERYSAAQLTQVMRQKNAWQQRATYAFATRDSRAALNAYLEHGRIHGCASTEEAYDAVVRAWAKARSDAPLATSLLLAFRRKDVHELNLRAREIRLRAGELGEDHLFATESGTRTFAINDRIVFLRNSVDVMNGTLGTVEHIANGKLAVRLDDQKKIVVDPATYPHFDHGYATTINKSQGVTVDYAFVYASRYMDAALTYVALSRHRRDAALFYSQREFKSTERLLRLLSRRRTKRMAIDVLGQEGVARALREELGRSERAFVDAATPDPKIMLAACEPVANQHLWTKEDIMQNWAYMPTEDERDVQRRAESRYEVRLAEYRALRAPTQDQRERALAEIEQARIAFDDATLALYGGKKLRRIENIARRHNATVERARTRVASLRELQQAATQQREIDQMLQARNHEALKARSLAHADQGVRFAVQQVVLQNGITILELVDPRGGPVVLAPASACYVNGASALIAPRPRENDRADGSQGRGR